MATAKAKQTKFFAENRRELVLQDYRTLMSRGEEKRMKLFVRMPLTNKPAVGIPKWISDPYVEMAKEDSLTGRVNIPNVFYEGMTLTVYSTDKIRRKTLTATGCMLIGFHLEATGEGESRQVFLCFTVYCPANIQLRDWAWDHLHKTWFADFEYSQTEMDFDGADAEEAETASAEDEDDDDDPLPETRAAVAASKRTNGHANA